MDDSSPYEPVAPNRHPDAFRLASISSGITAVITSELSFFFIFNIMDGVFREKLSCLLVDDNDI